MIATKAESKKNSTKQNSAKRSKMVMVAAGGTGGHIFPATAFVEVFRQFPSYKLALISDKRALPLSGALKRIDFYRIYAKGVSGRSRIWLPIALATLFVGFVQSLYILRKTRPDVVIGFGGYAALPPVLAANLTRVPTVLHEQNAVLGRANRLLLPGADRVALSFRATRYLEGSVRKGLAVWTGNPVRRAFRKMAEQPYMAIDGDKSTIRLLVLGGSQGASVFGTCVPKALALLPKELRARLHVCQQVRADQIVAVRKFYKDCGILAETKQFFADSAKQMASAHLLVCRAGATTLAELVTIGRPAILIPYPHAIDDHQRENALRIVRAGAGWMMPEETLSPETLSRKIASLLEHAEFLTMAASCARKLANENAEKQLVNLVRDLLDGVSQKKRAIKA